MKKFFSLLMAMLLVTGSYAAKQTSNESGFTKAVTATHQDVKDVISTTHEDASNVISTVYNDGKEVISTIYGDSKDLAGSLYPEVKSAVIAIAKALGVAAEHLYGVLVKKFVVDGIVQLLPFLLGILLLGVGWYKTSHYFKKEYLAQDGKIKWNFLYPVVLVIVGIIVLCNVNYNVMVMGLVNPEFGAINYILDFTKEMIK